MKFGGDFFKIIHFLAMLLKLFGRIFGDKQDNEEADKVEGNHAKHASEWLERESGKKVS